MSNVNMASIADIQKHTGINAATDSQQVRFAKIQYGLAIAAKGAAEQLMDGIKKNQEAQEECQKMLEYARDFRVKFTGKDEDETEGYSTRRLDILRAYCEKHNINDGDGNKDYKYLRSEVDLLIEGLSANLEKLGAKTETYMVQINDYMAQYNNYMQGANTAISNSNQTSAKIFG